jgi:adenine-specific DNA methylase
VSDKPRVLIEDWLPIAQIGAESQRERGASSALPPLYFLHVWWARRPLAVSRAAILSSLLPAWSEDWPKDLRKMFPTRDAYHEWFLKLLGIFGDPAAARRLLLAARDQGVPIPNPYGYPRVFTNNPTPEQIETVQALLRDTWGTVDPGVMDCFAGGGSIPFESLRYGFTTYANELNPVATVILKATLDYPARFGAKLPPLIAKYGKFFAAEVRTRLRPYFTDHGYIPDLVGACYLWARTVACPYTGKPIPLSPNWWLVKGAKPVAIEPIFSPKASEARFRIVEGREACRKVNPEKGSVRRGDGISPWAHDQVVSNEYIKTEASSGRMGEQLISVGLKKGGGFNFRAPSESDLNAVLRARDELKSRLPSWRAAGLLPSEPLPMDTEAWTHGNTPAQFDATTFSDLFSPRQLLALGTAVDVLNRLAPQLQADEGADLAVAVQTYLGFAIDKAADYNSRMVRWHNGRSVIVNTFDRHDFSFKWSHAEFDAAHNLFPWAVEQVVDALEGIVSLVDEGTQRRFARAIGTPAIERLTVSHATASSLSYVKDRSIGALVVDPPYYDNVNYAECSDYFYVWLKRTIGQHYNDLFADEYTNKDDEAVANPARFGEMGAKKKKLAEQDYERKMEACFREMHRILKDGGVLTVMFTHKKVEAWDTLGASLINAGFAVHSSWPVHTESEHSLHQAKKNAAASTILLTCRKRTNGSGPVWWDDIKGRVRQTAREQAGQYEKLGIRGVDLYIATFGPVLSVISERWPVLTSEVDPKTNKPKTLRPEAALEIAREEVVSLRKKGLLLGREVRFDPVTDWYLLAWDAFRAEQFPGDEARKLCLALDVDLEDTVVKSKRLVTKKGKNVTLQQPKGRRKLGMVDPDVEVFDCMLDAAHTAMLIFDEDGARNCERWLRQRGLDRDQRLKAVFQAMANAIPVTKKTGEYIRPEITLLDRMNDALGLGIAFPAEPEPDLRAIQVDLFKHSRVGQEEAEHIEGEDDEDVDEEDADDA